MSSFEAVGREREQAELLEFLQRVRDGPACISIVGEPGIGKSLLWSDLVVAAHERSFQVLSTRPIESDMPLSFAGLGDLLSGLDERVLVQLPPPQRRALEVALLRADASGPPLDRLAGSVATLTALRLLARSGPVLVAIDDLQWLDQPSARVVEFAARRLTDEAIGFICSRRSGESAPIDLALAFPAGRYEEMEVEPLSLGEFVRLIRARVERDANRSTLVRVHEACGGNPMFGIEMARALEGRDVDPSEPLPVPDNLLSLVQARLSTLSEPAREALTALAATQQRDVQTMQMIVGVESAQTVLREGLEAGVIELNDHSLRFTHPLFASSLMAELDDERRSETHALLANVANDPEARARHLALAAASSNEKIAGAVFAAAVAARARGAVDTAAELAGMSKRLTPEANVAGKTDRAIATGTYSFEAGNLPEARATLEEAIEMAPPGAMRAKALQHLGWVTTHAESWSKGLAHYHAALAEPHDDFVLQARIALDSSFAYMMTSDLPGAAADARVALDLAQRGDDSYAIAEAQALLAWFAFAMGRGIDRVAFERAASSERWDLPRYVEKRPTAVYAFAVGLALELDEARERFLELRDRVMEIGDASGMLVILFQLGMLETHAGNLPLAEEYARDGMLLADEVNQPGIKTFSLLAQARVDGCLGRLEAARAAGQEGLAIAARTDAVPGTIQHLHALGVLELSLGNHLGAHEHLANVSEMLLAHGTAEPVLVPFVPDEIEALIGLGETDKAERFVEMLEERGQTLGRKWAVAMGARGRGHLSAARKNKDGSLKEFDRAVALFEEMPLVIERGRAWLLKGQAERRFKQWGAARESLQQALGIFERVGARLWAERAAAELDRVGGRGPASSELTPSEERIASLVAQGKTNKQVAEALFLSVATVESNLKRIFRKIGVTSRTELTRSVLESARGEAGTA